MTSPYLAGFLSIVMHAPDIKSPRIDRVIRARNTWLREMQYVIVHGGDGPGTRPSWNTTDARLPFTNAQHGFLIDYPDSPGCTWTGSSTETNQGSLAPHKDCQKSPLEVPSTYQIGSYSGAHRTLAGILWANDTWANTAWTLVVDDDTMAIPSRIADWLLEKKINPDIPLLLSSRMGPGRNRVPCIPTSEVNRDRWGCCSDTTGPCHAFTHATGNFETSEGTLWGFNSSLTTFVPMPRCKKMRFDPYCCRSETWREGVKYGFPYRASPNGSSAFQFMELWPFGGDGFLLSRGLLKAIDRNFWLSCMNKLQCANADQRVFTCVLNAGFSMTRIEALPTIIHHAGHIDEDHPSCYAHHSLARTEDGKPYIDNDLCLSKETVIREATEDVRCDKFKQIIK